MVLVEVHASLRWRQCVRTRSLFVFFWLQLLPLMLELRSRRMLPAIVFHMSASGCETLAKWLLEDLVAEENEYR